MLSQPIKELIGRLTSALKQETQAAIGESQSEHQHKVQSLTGRIQELEAALTDTNKTLEERERELQNELAELNASKACDVELKAKVTKASQAEEKLQALLVEK